MKSITEINEVYKLLQHARDAVKNGDPQEALGDIYEIMQTSATSDWYNDLVRALNNDDEDMFFAVIDNLIVFHGEHIFLCNGGMCSYCVSQNSDNETVKITKDTGESEVYSTKGTKILFHLCDYCVGAHFEIERLSEKE